MDGALLVIDQVREKRPIFAESELVFHEKWFDCMNTPSIVGVPPVCTLHAAAPNLALHLAPVRRIWTLVPIAALKIKLADI